MKFVVAADYRHAAHRGMRPNKLIGFLIHRNRQSKRSIIEKIFSRIHTLAEHHNIANMKKWRCAHRRLIKRYKRSI